jgi:ribosomal protein L11 methylase PrmA
MILGKFVLIVGLLIVFFLILFAFVPLIFFWGAIYLPTKKETIKKMIELAKIKPGDRAVDLGAGDGRLVIALAKAGAEAHGYEINPFLVFLAKLNIYRAGLKNKAFIHFKNFWEEDLSDFDIVVVFGISHIMKKLEAKIEKELKVGTRIISNSFSFPGWSASKKEDGVYLYKF